MANRKIFKKITDKIIKEYKPEKIILFGSYAWGKPKKDSDLDLFIVKKTKTPRGERHIQVDRLLFDRDIPIDILVYTPREVRQRLLLGDFFIQDIVNQGEILYEKK